MINHHSMNYVIATYRDHIEYSKHPSALDAKDAKIAHILSGASDAKLSWCPPHALLMGDSVRIVERDPRKGDVR